MSNTITVQRELLQRALDALVWASDLTDTAQQYKPLHDAIAALNAELNPVGWVCPKCGTDRLKAACPSGYHAALTGQCPMVGTAHTMNCDLPAYYDSEGGSMCNGIGRDYF